MYAQGKNLSCLFSPITFVTNLFCVCQTNIFNQVEKEVSIKHVYLSAVSIYINKHLITVKSTDKCHQVLKVQAVFKISLLVFMLVREISWKYLNWNFLNSTKKDIEY